MKARILLLLMFIPCSFISLFADDRPQMIDIVDLAEEAGAELSFDYWKGIYELRKGGLSLRLSDNSTYYLQNYEVLKKGMNTELDDGQLYLHSDSADEVRLFFKEVPATAHGIKYIVLDPGHGGKDPGAIGYYNDGSGKKQLKEKDIVLDTALKTAAMLESRYPGREVILTRSDDRYLKLEERTEIANSVELKESESMIFISIHANASFNTTANGFEVWYLPPEFRRDLIDPESVAGVDSDVIPILNTMLEEEFTVESVILGEKLLSSIDGEVGELTENRGPKEESWFVVRNARMPSVLIELGFVTNNEEAILLSSDAYLKKLSKGIYNGVVDFIDDYERIRGYTE